MEFKGTKGEWKPRLAGTLSKVESQHGCLVAWGLSCEKRYTEDLRESGESWLEFRKRTKSLRDLEETETEANAKLIAAAPELLEALNRIKNLKPSDTMDSHGNWCSAHHYATMQKIAKEAIEKAIG